MSDTTATGCFLNRSQVCWSSMLARLDVQSLGFDEDRVEPGDDLHLLVGTEVSHSAPLGRGLRT